MKKLGQQLNLKPHEVGSLSSPKTVYTPVDLGEYFACIFYLTYESEAHNGFDNRLYLLDFSRVFPPCTPESGARSAYLYRLLRGEFVRRWASPLCSDAFSNFTRGQISYESHNTDANAIFGHTLLFAPKLSGTTNKAP